MTADIQTRSIAIRDVFTGTALIFVGLLATIIAQDFDSVSRAFPVFLSVLLIASGIALIIAAIINPAMANAALPGIRGPSLVCLTIAVWAAALTAGVGFLISTLLMQTAILRISGMRKPGRLVGTALLITILTYVMFAVLLDVSLPASRLPATLQGL